MISLEPTEKQLALQEHFRRLAVKRLQPRSILVDAAEPTGVDPDYSAVIAEENLNAFLIPEEYGGKPLDWMSLAILFEELGAGCAGFAAVYAQTFHSVAALLIGGSEEQKKSFFPPSVSAGRPRGQLLRHGRKERLQHLILLYGFQPKREILPFERR